MGSSQNVSNVARLHCPKRVRYPKKFDLVHQTISPCEKVGSGDETNRGVASLPHSWSHYSKSSLQKKNMNTSIV